MFRSQQIIIREYVCTSLKLLNYLNNTEFKILKIIPGVVAAKRVAGVRGDPFGVVRLTHYVNHFNFFVVVTSGKGVGLRLDSNCGYFA